MRHPNPNLLISMFLIVATIAVFWQVQNYEFVDFDDNVHIFENRLIQTGLSLEGIIWAFTTTYPDYWHPLPWLMHMLNYQLFGLNPGGYHFTNLLFHIANTLLLFLVLKRMTGAFWRSSFVSALFALHPLHVESVVWVTECKDVLSTFFWMLTIWAYLHYVESPSLNRYLIVFLFLALGLMSKPMLVTIPFVLLLLDYWPLRRLQFGKSNGANKAQTNKFINQSCKGASIFHLVLEKIPLLVLSFVSIYVIFFLRQGEDIVIHIENRSINLRVANALVSYVSYIGKMFWPHHLSTFYPYPNTLPLWKVSSSVLLLFSLSVLLIRNSQRYPYNTVGWLWYIGTLLPVIGLVQWGLWPSMADRFTYVPLIGLFIIITWIFPDILARWRYCKIGLTLSACLVLSTLMICTWLQVRHWENSIKLFSHAIQVTSNNYPAHYNLGVILARHGKTKQALDHYYETLRIRPDYVKAHYNLGVALARQDKIEEAITHYYEALRTKPDYIEAHNNLAVALASQGMFKKAIAHLGEAIRIKRDYADAHYNLGNIFAEQGKTDKAIIQYHKVLQINPDNSWVHYNMGNALAAKGRSMEAISHYFEALRIEPDFAEAHNNLGLAFVGQGKIKEAIVHFSKAVEIKPNFVWARKNLKNAMMEMGKPKGQSQ